MTYVENDATFTALAVELLAEFGAPATFKVASGGTYARASGTVPGSVYTIYADVLATPPVPREDMFRADDTLVKGSHVVWLAASGLAFTPAPGIGMTQGGAEWTVTGVKSFQPGLQVAAYALFVETTR